MATTDTLPPAINPDAEDQPAGKSFLRENGLVIVVGGMVAAGMLFIVIQLAMQEEFKPKEKVAEALELLDTQNDVSARQQAIRIARKLLKHERLPEFPGAAEYILGMSAFQAAESDGESLREQNYEFAAKLLREAERQTFIPSRRPEWAFALGASLQRLGLGHQARSLLEEAVESYEPRKLDAAIMLVDVYLDTKSQEDLTKSLELNSNVLAAPDLNQDTRDRAYLQRAHILLLLQRNHEAEETLKLVSDKTADSQGTTVFRAQMLMAEGKYEDALQLLEPVAVGTGLDETYPRQAIFLMGMCAERLDRIDAAISYFERAAQKYASSHEGLAANLKAGDLLREMGRKEEALEAYQRALKMERSPEEFRNRWLSIDEFRNRIEEAWNAWINEHSYEEAIALADLMPPLIPEIRARRLAARANERWAEHIEATLAVAPFSERARLSRQLLNQWRVSGDAYAQLAESLKTSADYGNAIWTSAEQFRKGKDFENAVHQYSRFIKLRPKQLLPTAYVRLGQVLMDMDRLEEAAQKFQTVLDEHPRDPAAFEAQYIIAQCYLEQNDVKQAETVWRKILLDEALTPAAREWRLSLFSLGKLLYHTAAIRKNEAEPDSGRSTLAESEKKKLLSEAQSRWAESVRRLEEFLSRYPDADEATEARYLLAKGLQHSAEFPRRKLATAETENAKFELNRSIQTYLDQAIRELRTLQQILDEQRSRDALSPLGKRVLRDCYFEIAHTHYALKHYKEAIVAYQVAANRYLEDPHVLLAYLQMSNCYAHLGEDVEARSMLEQAKIIFKQMPDSAFDKDLTNMNRTEWEQWLNWARRLHSSPESTASVTN